MSDAASPETATSANATPENATPGVDAKNRSADAYWRKNRQLIAILLAIWALVSYGFALLLPMPFRIGQLPANFWWAQQGSMFVFVILIFVYAWRMDKIDREFDVDEER